MRKSTLLKIAMTLTAMFFISGVFAQINLTVRNASDGLPAVGAVVYTLNSSDASVTTFGAASDAAGLVTWTPGGNGQYFYLVRNAGNTTWASISVNYTGAIVNATVYLDTKFNPTIGSYVASRNNEKVTIGKTLPLWVYPSPVHNPAFQTVPFAPFETKANLTTNVQSTFAWTKTGNATLNTTSAGDAASDNNYVEVTGGTTAGDVTSIQVTETSAAAYGGCNADPVYFNFTSINPPYAKITNGAAGYTLDGAANTISTIAFGCTPVSANVTVAFDNASEEFPYYVRAIYSAFNATISGTNVTTGSAVTFNDALKPRGGVTVADPADQSTNPLKFSAAGNMYAAPMSFPTVNDKITVYKVDLGSWNGTISRKSDYLALTAATAGNIATGAYTWYTGGAAGTSGQPATDVTVAYIIVFPKPVTGPIYHIPNSFGNF